MEINPLYHFGRYLMMLKQVFSKPEKIWMYRNETFRQMHDIGIGSLVIIALISVFIGAVIAIQFAYQLSSGMVPDYYIGYIVRDISTCPYHIGAGAGRKSWFKYGSRTGRDETERAH